jgi:4-hydroxybenzoate polyprenyltransferase
MTFSRNGFVHAATNPFWIFMESGIRIRGIIEILLFTSTFVALISVGMAYISCFIQNLRVNAACYIIPFLVVFAIYNLNKKTDEQEDAINRLNQYLFMKQYGRILSTVSLLGLACAIILAFPYGPGAVMVTCFPLVLGVLYSIRCFPRNFHYQRLKEIPLLKNLIVGFSWAFLPGLLPVYLNHSSPGFTTLITCIIFFTWGFTASMIPDIRDRDGDERAGIKTIPVIYGDTKARHLLFIVNLLVAILVMRLILPVFPHMLTILVIGSFSYSQMSIYLMKREDIRNFVSDIISDGQFIFLLASLHILL